VGYGLTAVEIDTPMMASAATDEAPNIVHTVTLLLVVYRSGSVRLVGSRVANASTRPGTRGHRRRNRPADKYRSDPFHRHFF
jgi:hypothetical protein